MKIILTRKGEKIKVSDEDFDMLSQYTWYIDRSAGKGNGYAHTNIYIPDGNGDFVRNAKGHKKQQRLKMHRFICGLEKGDGKEVDHIDRDTLNNQRNNLRVIEKCSTINRLNRGARKDNQYGFPGVNFHKTGGGKGKHFQARIQINKKRVNLGFFNTPEAAYEAYLLEKLNHQCVTEKEKTWLLNYQDLSS